MCVSVLEHVAPGNDRLLLWEAARVLKPAGRLIVTFDVAPVAPLRDGERLWPDNLRRFEQPFTVQTVRRLLEVVAGHFEVTPDERLFDLEQLTWDDVHAFWRAAQEHDAWNEPLREYLALGTVLQRRTVVPELTTAASFEAYSEGQAALLDRLRYFESHAHRRLHALEQVVDEAKRLRTESEEKEQVIGELESVAEERLRVIEQLDDHVSQLHSDFGIADRQPAELDSYRASPTLAATVDGLAERMASIERALAAQSVQLTRFQEDYGRALLEREAPAGPVEDELARHSDLLARLVSEIATATARFDDARHDAAKLSAEELRLLKREGEAAQATADARLAVIVEQQKAIEHYRRFRFGEHLTNFTSPRIGQLYQYAPRKMQIPASYLRVPSLTSWPTLTVVTPTFNQGVFIKRTVESVLTQKYPGLEYIIKDAGSTDETMSILEPFRQRLAHVESTPDHGLANGINIGFARSAGELMAYLNSDDLLLPGALHYVAAFFSKHPDIDVVYGHRVVIDEYDREIGRWVLPPHDNEILSWADYVPQETLFWRRRIWDAVGGSIDESFRFAVDWDLLIRFRDAGAKMVACPVL